MISSPARDVLSAVALRHQVHRLRRPTQENDLVRVGCAKELADFFAPSFEELGRARREGVRRAMNVRVIAAVKRGGGVDDALRLLCGCSIVEPDERFAVHPLVERWKIAPDCLHIKDGKRWSARRLRRSRNRPLVNPIVPAQEVEFWRANYIVTGDRCGRVGHIPTASSKQDPPRRNCRRRCHCSVVHQTHRNPCSTDHVHPIEAQRRAR